jgi:transcriptional adapter 3
MPPMGGKSKPKVRDGRQSQSRNTTPGSIVSVPINVVGPSNTMHPDTPMSGLVEPSTTSYEDILGRHSGGGIPDPRHLEHMARDLTNIDRLADSKGETFDTLIRELARMQKDRIDEEREREKLKRELEEKEILKRVAEEEDDARGRRATKPKKLKKERSDIREERPLTHGAHGVARQDGLDLPTKGMYRTQIQDAYSSNFDSIAPAIAS